MRRAAVAIIALLLLPVGGPALAQTPTSSPTSSPSGCVLTDCPTVAPTVTATATASPTPSRTRTRTPTPSPSRRRRSRTPTPRVSISSLPVAPPVFTESPVPTPSITTTPAAAGGSGPPVGRLIAYALAAVVVLGAGGAAGLYLTREPK